MESPVTVAVRAPLDQLAVAPPGLAVTVYTVICAPPLETGALHVTTAWALPAVPATFVGASGTVAGVTKCTLVDPGLVPTAFVAVTVNV